MSDTPTPAGPTSDADLRDLVMDHEDAAAQAAVAPWDQWTAEAMTELALLWDLRWGDTTPDLDEVTEWLATVRLPVPPTSATVAAAIRAEAGEAAASAVVMMLPEVDRDDRMVARVSAAAVADERVTGALGGLDDIDDEVNELLSVADAAGNLDDELAHIQFVGARGRNRSQSAARWTVNATANRARILTAAELEQTVGAPLVLVWTPETDACVHCLAYAGEMVPADGTGTFPEGLSFDPRGGLSTFGDLPSPPLHPHCRCDLEPWSLEWGDELPVALRREAERSVLRGTAMPSEGDAARRRAAEELLNEGTEELDVRSVERGAERRLARTEPFARPTEGR